MSNPLPPRSAEGLPQWVQSLDKGTSTVRHHDFTIINSIPRLIKTFWFYHRSSKSESDFRFHVSGDGNIWYGVGSDSVRRRESSNNDHRLEGRQQRIHEVPEDESYLRYVDIARLNDPSNLTVYCTVHHAGVGREEGK